MDGSIYFRIGIVGYKPVKKALTEAPVEKNITLVIYKDTIIQLKFMTTAMRRFML